MVARGRVNDTSLGDLDSIQHGVLILFKVKVSCIVVFVVHYIALHLCSTLYAGCRACFTPVYSSLLSNKCFCVKLGRFGLCR